MTNAPEGAGAQSPAGPLAGIRVLSLAEQYPGPFATMILADLGADVILIERPAGGDPTRRFGGHFQALNRGKRSVAVDLKSRAGAAVLMKLAETADVIVEGFRPGVMERLGFGARTMRDLFPALLYCSISSFGQTGPLSMQGGHDLSIQGMAGFVQSNGSETPSPAELPLADLSSAMYAAIGILTGLFAKQRGGQAAQIDVSMLDCLVAWRSTAIASAVNEMDPAPYPPLDPGYGVFKTRSGEYLTLSIAGEDHQWRALCEVIGAPEMAALDFETRERRKDELTELVQQRISHLDAEMLLDELGARGVGCGRVNSDMAVVEDPQVLARNLVVPVIGAPAIRVVRQPILFNGYGGAVQQPAPDLGQHTEEVLQEAGYSEADFAQLFADGVLVERRAVAAAPRTGA